MRDRQNIATLVILLLVVLNVLFSASLWWSINSFDDRINDVERSQEEIEDYILVSGIGDGERANSGSVTDGSGTIELARSHGDIIGIDGVTNEGVLIPFRYQPLPGGSVYVEITDAEITEDTQESFKEAQQAVLQTSYDPQATGMALTIDPPTNWENIGGKSAALPIAAHIAATDDKYDLNTSVAATGEVTPQGELISVQNVDKKAKAARDNGYNTIISPPLSGPITVEGITVIQVRNLEDALQYLLKKSD